MPTPSQRAPARLFAALAVTTTFGFGLLVYTVGVMISPMSAELGWSNATLSAGPTIGLATSGLLAPKVGRFVDHHGGRRVMVIGSITGAIGVAVWAVSTTPVLYLAAWLVIGTGMAMSLYEPAFAAVVKHVPDRRRQGVLAITLMGALASTIFLPLASWLLDLLGWRQALVVLAVGHVMVTTPLCVSWIPSRSTVTASRPSDPVGAAAPGTESPPSLVSSSRLRRITIVKVLGGSANVSVGIHVVSFLIGSGVSATRAALTAALLGLAKIVGRIAIGFAARRHAGHTLLTACLCLMGVSLLIGVVAPTIAGQATMIVLFGIGGGGMTVAQPLVIVEQFGTRTYGITAGRISRMSSLSFSIAPFAVGALVTVTASYVVPWLLLATGCAVAAWLLPHSTPRADP
ncbi:MAG: MFS transporter [Nitriliruptoraceae bacterium]